MDDARTPDEEQPLPSGPPAAPVIPAPKRRSMPVAGPADAAPGALVEDPFAEQPSAAGAQEAPAPELDLVPETDAPAAAIDVLEVVAPEPVVAAEPVAAEPAALEDGAAEAPAGAVAEAGEPVAVSEETSLEEMVAGLREDESGETAAEAALADAEVDGMSEAGETAEGAEPGEPEPATAEAQAAETEPAEDTRALRRRSSKMPFYVYMGVWLVFAGVQTYLLWPLATAPFVSQPVYGLLVLVATGLVCAGLVLGLSVWWYVSAHSEPAERDGLVRAMLMRSATAMTVGVIIWWAALLLLDLRRTGALG